MDFAQIDDAAQRTVLSQALRALRQRRKLTVAKIAHQMAMAKRSYEYLQAGKSGLRLDRIQLFAEAADSDAAAIVAAMMLGRPELAIQCADTKLFSIVQHAVAKLSLELGDDMFQLTARDCLSVMQNALQPLAEMARARRQAADAFHNNEALTATGASSANTDPGTRP